MVGDCCGNPVISIDIKVIGNPVEETIKEGKSIYKKKQKTLLTTKVLIVGSPYNSCHGKVIA